MLISVHVGSFVPAHVLKKKYIFSYSAELQINDGDASVLSVSEFPLLPTTMDFFFSFFFF